MKKLRSNANWKFNSREFRVEKLMHDLNKVMGSVLATTNYLGNRLFFYPTRRKLGIIAVLILNFSP